MKIIVIGSPGSGKSTIAKKIAKVLKYPIMHLDKIYHTGGKGHITREELCSKVESFASSNNDWIIDGNYISTIERRIQLADTIILFDIPSDICVENAYKREMESKKGTICREDMADGFDETVTDEFIEFIKNFKTESYPKIEKILSKHNDKKIITIKDYIEINDCINTLLEC